MHEISVPEALFLQEHWTEEQYFALPDPYLRRMQLLDGQLLVSPNPSRKHQRIAYHVCAALNALKPADIEVLEGLNVRVRLGSILIPDIVVVRGFVEDENATDAASVAAVVEIGSPSTGSVDRLLKPQLYAEAGIPIYVRIQKAGPHAIVGRLVGDRYVWSEPDPILRLDYPFPVEIDLATLVAPRGAGAGA